MYNKFITNKARAENPELYYGLELICSAGLDDGDSGNELYMTSYKYTQIEPDKISSTDASDFAGATDHHYYNTPIRFLQHSDYYNEENYSRTEKDMTSNNGSSELLDYTLAVQGIENNIFRNIGGWESTVSTLKQVECYSKTGQFPDTTKDFVVETGITYELKVEVKGDTVKCYIDDKLYIDYDFGSDKEYECYSVVSIADNGDIIIKLVNVTDISKTIAVNLNNAEIASDFNYTCPNIR